MDRRRTIEATREVAESLRGARTRLRRMLRSVTEAEFKTGAAAALARETVKALERNRAAEADRFLAALRELRPDAVAWAAEALATVEEELEAVRTAFTGVLSKLEQQLAGEEVEG